MRALTFGQKTIGALALLLGVAVAAIAVSQFVDLDEFVEADVLRIEGNTIILGEGCRVIVADTSPERADSIRLGLEDRIDERPNTHDTFVQAMKSYGISVDSMSLTYFDGRIYYADLVLRSDEKVLKLDAKPSDAIAIAIRADAPLFVNRTLLGEIGRDICP